MSIAHGLLAELEQELAATRRMLEILPDDKLGFKPHEKSMGLGALATHIAMIPRWGAVMMTTPEYDVSTAPEHAPVANAAEAVRRLDESGAALEQALAASDDAALLAPWTLKAGPRTIFTMPRIAATRGMIMNHLSRHCAN